MSRFRTEVKPVLSDSFAKISHTDTLLSVGSCFADTMGNYLRDCKFNILINPAGIIFNPISIAKVLLFALENKVLEEEDLLFTSEKWFNFNFHSQLSSKNKEECLNKLNSCVSICRNYLLSSKTLILTFGSAWAYKFINSDEIVANCYKINSSEFNKVLLTPNLLEDTFEDLLRKIKKANPGIQILITVSPIRHWKDGVIENQQSKSTLILLAHRLRENFGFVHYFPSYEIMMDDLRDYRFYEDDMFHPSKLARDYIWDKFCDVGLDLETKKNISVIKELSKAMHHKPFDASSENFKQFALRNKKKAEEIQNKLPQLNFNEEMEYFNRFLR